MLKIETVPPPRNSTKTESRPKHSEPTDKKFGLELETQRKKLTSSSDSSHRDRPGSVRAEGKCHESTQKLQFKRSRKAAKAITEQPDGAARQTLPPGGMDVEGIACPIDPLELPTNRKPVEDPACPIVAASPSEVSVPEDGEPEAVAANVLANGNSRLDPVFADSLGEGSPYDFRVSQPVRNVVESKNPQKLQAADDTQAIEIGEEAQVKDRETVQESVGHVASAGAFRAETEGMKMAGRRPAESTDPIRPDTRSKIENPAVGPEPSTSVSRTDIQTGSTEQQYSPTNYASPDPSSYGQPGNSHNDSEGDSPVRRTAVDASSPESRSSLSGSFEAHGTRGVESSASFHSLVSEQAPGARQSEMLDQMERADVMSQLVEKARLFRWENNSELHISLRPENLGHVTLRASIVDRTLVATIAADSDKVRHLLELELPALHRSLREDGMLAKVVVAQGSDLNFNNPGGGQSQSQLQQQNPNSHASGGTPDPWLTPTNHTRKVEAAVLPEMADSRYLSRSIHLIA